MGLLNTIFPGLAFDHTVVHNTTSVVKRGQLQRSTSPTSTQWPLTRTDIFFYKYVCRELYLTATKLAYPGRMPCTVVLSPSRNDQLI